MTDGQIKAMFTLLEYIARLLVEQRRDTGKLIKRQHDSVQTMRRLRAKLAKLQAGKNLSRDVARALAEFLPEPESHKHSAAIKKDFAINKGGKR